MSFKMLARPTILMGLVFAIGCVPSTHPQPESNDVVLQWNQIAIDASGLDHTPPSPGETRVYKEQLGPTRASRAMAIVHIAMFDAIDAVEGGYDSYTRVAAPSKTISTRIAVAQAAHNTLMALFPAQTTTFDQHLTDDLNAVEDGEAKAHGVLLGVQVAATVLAMREADGSDWPESYTFSNLPGFWRVDPINPLQTPLGSQWFKVKPFALDAASQFRAPVPPSMTSAEYTEAFNEVKSLGGDGITTPTIRTDDQTRTGIYWAYDGTPSLCAPPRLYNQVARQIAQDRGVDSGLEMARLLALLNVAMADAAIAVWDSKYYYNFWRPVTGIREADPGTGPTGVGDGNPDTLGDPTYVPLCAPASNLIGSNFTPPFPSYPSGHAGFGGAIFETLRQFFGTDDIAFTFTSDEFNGVTRDHEGNIRPLIPRSFSTLSQAEEENGQSRIYLGIHWRFDKTEGIAQGRKVADHVFNNLLRPQALASQ